MAGVWSPAPSAAAEPRLALDGGASSCVGNAPASGRAESDMVEERVKREKQRAGENHKPHGARELLLSMTLGGGG